MEYERINWENLPSQETPIYLLASSENTVILDAVGDGETDDTEALSEVFNRSNSVQDVDVTGVAAGETLIHVSIPYGVEYVYEVIVT